MKCSETEQFIQLYIDDQLTGPQLRDFLTHIESCPKCYEEMEINYLIKEALLRLEDGKTFDLRKELKQKIQSSIAIRQLLLLGTMVMLAIMIARMLILYGVNI